MSVSKKKARFNFVLGLYLGVILTLIPIFIASTISVVAFLNSIVYSIYGLGLGMVVMILYLAKLKSEDEEKPKDEFWKRERKKHKL